MDDITVKALLEYYTNNIEKKLSTDIQYNKFIADFSSKKYNLEIKYWYDVSEKKFIEPLENYEFNTVKKIDNIINYYIFTTYYNNCKNINCKYNRERKYKVSLIDKHLNWPSYYINYSNMKACENCNIIYPQQCNTFDNKEEFTIYMINNFTFYYDIYMNIYIPDIKTLIVNNKTPIPLWMLYLISDKLMKDKIYSININEESPDYKIYNLINLYLVNRKTFLQQLEIRTQFIEQSIFDKLLEFIDYNGINKLLMPYLSMFNKLNYTEIYQIITKLDSKQEQHTKTTEIIETIDIIKNLTEQIDCKNKQIEMLKNKVLENKVLENSKMKENESTIKDDIYDNISYLKETKDEQIILYNTILDMEQKIKTLHQRNKDLKNNKDIITRMLLMNEYHTTQTHESMTNLKEDLKQHDSESDIYKHILFAIEHDKNKIEKSREYYIKMKKDQFDIHVDEINKIETDIEEITTSMNEKYKQLYSIMKKYLNKLQVNIDIYDIENINNISLEEIINNKITIYNELHENIIIGIEQQKKINKILEDKEIVEENIHRIEGEIQYFTIKNVKESQYPCQIQYLKSYKESLEQIVQSLRDEYANMNSIIKEINNKKTKLDEYILLYKYIFVEITTYLKVSQLTSDKETLYFVTDENKIYKFKQDKKIETNKLYTITYCDGHKEIKQVHEELKRKTEYINNELINVKKSVDMIETEKQTMNTKIIELETTIQTLNNKIKETEINKQPINDVEKDNEICKLEKEKRLLINELINCRQIINNTESEKHAFYKKLNYLDTMTETMNKKITILETEKETLNNTITKLETEKETLNNKFTKLCTEKDITISELGIRKQIFDYKITTLETDKEILNNKFTKRYTDKDIIISELEIRKQIFDYTITKLEKENEIEKEILNNKISELEKEKETLNDKIIKLERDNQLYKMQKNAIIDKIYLIENTPFSILTNDNTDNHMIINNKLETDKQELISKLDDKSKMNDSIEMTSVIKI